MTAGAARPRLVATDLDRTLLDGDGLVSPRTRAALQAVEAAGIEVVFVTGRPPRWIDTVGEDVGGHEIVVCANGALVLDLATKETLLARTLAADVVLKLARRLRDALPDLGFGVESTAGLAVEPTFVPALPFPDPPRTGQLVDLLDPAPVKLLGRDGVHSSDELLSTAIPLCEGLGAGVGRRPARHRRRRRVGVRGLAQRPPDAGLGRPVVRRGQRPPCGAGRGDAPHHGAHRPRGGARAGAARPLT